MARGRLPWIRFYIGDFVGDTRHLTLAQVGAYVRLLERQWFGGSLPVEPAKLARICGAPADEFEREIWPDLAEFFDSNGDGLVNLRLERERTEEDRFRKERSQRARKAARDGYGKFKKEADLIRTLTTEAPHTRPHEDRSGTAEPGEPQSDPVSVRQHTTSSADRSTTHRRASTSQSHKPEPEKEQDQNRTSPRSSTNAARATPDLSTESPGEGQERGVAPGRPEPEHVNGQGQPRESLEDTLARIREHGPGSKPAAPSSTPPGWPDDPERWRKVESVVRWLAPAGKAPSWLQAAAKVATDRRDGVYASIVDTETNRRSRRFDATVARKDLMAALRGESMTEHRDGEVHDRTEAP